MLNQGFLRRTNPLISLPIILPIIVTALLLSCGDDNVINPPQDREPPATTKNLSIDSLSSGSIRLTWTAPGDDSVTGQASEYDIRYSTSDIDSSNWSLAASCTNTHPPAIAFSIESFAVTGLEPMTKYFFALRTSDESHNWSEVSNIVSAQTPDSIIVTWERTYGGYRQELLTRVVVAPDGGYVMAGNTTSFGSGWGDAYLVKADEYGNQVWQQVYGRWMAENAYSLAITPDGGYIMAGYAGFTDFMDDTLDAYLVKVDGSGSVMWERVFGSDDSDMAFDVAVVPDGGYIVAGYRSDNRPEGSLWLVRLDEDGNIVWEHKYGENINDIAYRAVPTDDGGFIACGVRFLDGVTWSPYLLKVDGSGNTVWDKLIGNEVDAMASRDVLVTPDGGYIVTGWARGNGYDVFVTKLDEAGNTVWAKTYGGIKQDFATSIIATPDGGYIAAGATWSYGAGANDIYLIKIDGYSGNLIWTKTYGGASNEVAESIAATPDGGYVIGAQTLSYGAGGADFYVLKVDAEGNL